MANENENLLSLEPRLCILHLFGFAAFHVPVASLPSVQDKQEKQFIFRHSRSVFELLDADGSNNISADEFESFGFLFNFERRAVRQIFREFDVSGDQVCTAT